MTQTLAPTTDNYLNWVNTEAISYVSTDEAAGSETTTEISHARSFRFTKADVAQLGGTRGGRSWRIPIAVAGGITPKRSDRFTDASGQLWHVEDVDLLRREEQWRLLCVEATV